MNGVAVCVTRRFHETAKEKGLRNTQALLSKQRTTIDPLVRPVVLALPVHPELLPVRQVLHPAHPVLRPVHPDVPVHPGVRHRLEARLCCSLASCKP